MNGLSLNHTHGTVGAASRKPVANHRRVAAPRIECRVRVETGDEVGGLPDSPSTFVRVRRQRITHATPPRAGAKATVCPVAPVSVVTVISGGSGGGGGQDPLLVTGRFAPHTPLPGLLEVQNPPPNSFAHQVRKDCVHAGQLSWAAAAAKRKTHKR